MIMYNVICVEWIHGEYVNLLEAGAPKNKYMVESSNDGLNNRAIKRHKVSTP